MGEVLRSIGDALSGSFSDVASLNILQLLQAVLALIVGWLVATLVGWGIKKSFSKFGIGKRLGKMLGRKEKVDISGYIGQAGFYFIMLFALVAFFEFLGLELITTPLNSVLTQISEYIPRLVSAGVILAVAWVVATIVRIAVNKSVTLAKLDSKLSSSIDVLDEKSEKTPTNWVSEFLYYFVFIFFLPAILEALQVQSLLTPVQDVTNQVVSYLPSLLGAGMVLVVGWLGASLIRSLVSGVLENTGLNTLGQKLGISKMFGSEKLSSVTGTIIYAFLMLQVISASLELVQIDAISVPLSNMVSSIYAKLPSVLVAFGILIVAKIIADLVKKLSTQTLKETGFDNLLEDILGVKSSQYTPSAVVGIIGFWFVMVFGLIEALNIVGLTVITAIITNFATYSTQIISGVLTLIVGLWIANKVEMIVQKSGSKYSKLLASLAKAGVVLLAVSMALQETNLATDIVVSAFQFILGALAVAFAIAFGLGGKEVATEMLRDTYNKVKK